MIGTKCKDFRGAKMAQASVCPTLAAGLNGSYCPVVFSGVEPMLPATADAIVCPTCGKRYLCKPELAGKQVRCKCGTVIAVPALGMSTPGGAAAPDAITIQDQPPPMAPLSRPAADSDDLYD